MKKILFTALALSTYLSIKSQPSVSLSYGNNFVGKLNKNEIGESFSGLVNLPVKTGTFVNITGGLHSIVSNGVGDELTLPKTIKTSTTAELSIMQGISDYVYLEAGAGMLIDEVGTKPLVSTCVGLLLLDKKTAKIAVEARNYFTKNNIMTVGQVKLFMPIDGGYEIKERKHTTAYPSKPQKSKHITHVSTNKCFSF